MTIGAAPAAPFLKNVIAALGRGDSRAALHAASEACHREPRAPQVHYVYGQAWLALDALAQAERAFAAALQLTPGWADAWVNYGVARYRQDAIEDAKTAMREALSAEPGHAAATSNLGAFLRITGDPNSGEGLLRVAIAAQPDNGGARLNLAAGTRIATSDGKGAVESLRVGDMAVTTLGAHRPISWLGHRTLDCRRHPRPQEIMPVRITAHALGPNRPAHDLRVSPGHAICVDLLGEVLIPAGALINGSTIVQQEVESVTYWHVELEGGHDILLAENLPCESYLEMGNRSFFAEAEATALHAIPDARAITHADFCRPFHTDGPVVAFVRERLAARIFDLGWTLAHEPLADLHLIAEGRRIEPEASGLCARFLVPAEAKEVWLVSDTGVPAEIGIAPDLRRLGVCVGSLVVDDGFGTPRTVLADDPRLCVGFHAIEDGPQRWTAGRARLPAELWEGCRGSVFLRVDLTCPALPKWAAPYTSVRVGEMHMR